MRYIAVILCIAILSMMPLSGQGKSKDKIKNLPDNANAAAQKDKKIKNEKSISNKKSPEAIRSRESMNTLTRLDRNQEDDSDFSAFRKSLEALKKEIKKNQKNHNELITLIKINRAEIELLLNRTHPDTVGADLKNKNLIQSQINTIDKSRKNILKLLARSESVLQNESPEEELFNITLEIEKEIKTIDRQYRAIEWILSESE